MPNIASKKDFKQLANIDCYEMLIRVNDSVSS